MEPRMESCLAQVLQKDVGKRLQVGQELIDYFSDKQKSADLEHDQTMLDKLVDGLATSWVNSSNYKTQGDPRRDLCWTSEQRHACRAHVKEKRKELRLGVSGEICLPS
uniref:Cytoplasmic linker associated protein 1 n=1 Tax=Equus caballus TaxID=9796 RepID=A0A9L0RBN9_HORSE